MPTVLKIVGGLWAAIGAGNLLGMPWTTAGTGLLTIGLMFNFLLFVLPGLGLFGIGYSMDKRKRTAPPSPVEVPSGVSIEDRLSKLDGLRDKGLISDQEYQTQRNTILAQV